LNLQKSEKPEWKNISLNKATKHMKMSFALIQLIYASSNAKVILNEKATDYTYERIFDHLEKLGEEIEL